MSIAKKQVEHIAKLARLGLSKQEKEKFQKDFESILGFIEKLNEVNTEKIEPTAHVTELENIMREDKGRTTSEVERNKLLESAPEIKQEYVKVKAVL